MSDTQGLPRNDPGTLEPIEAMRHAVATSVAEKLDLQIKEAKAADLGMLAYPLGMARIEAEEIAKTSTANR